MELGERYGYRNAQATVLAPTGTISFLMDCDTTGVEPDFSLVKFKELVGGGQMTIVNRTVPLALQTLGYSEQQVEQIEAHLAEHGTIIGAPGLREEHLPVFDVAVGERAISHMGHIKMMGAVQPFISGAISKTVNMPQESTVEDIADAYTQAWRLGSQGACDLPRRLEDRTGAAHRRAAGRARSPRTSTRSWSRPSARRSPRPARGASGCRVERQSITHKFSIARPRGLHHRGHVRGRLGRGDLPHRHRQGGLDAARDDELVRHGDLDRAAVRRAAGDARAKFSYMRFEPEGITGNPEIPFAKSMPDYIMRWLASRFLDVDAQEELGILTPAVRARKAAQETAQAMIASDTASPAAEQQTAARTGRGNGGTRERAARRRQRRRGHGTPAAASCTDSPPVVPARLQGLDLGPACSQCGGMMQRTGSCYTCSSLRQQHRLRLTGDGRRIAASSIARVRSTPREMPVPRRCASLTCLALAGQGRRDQPVLPEVCLRRTMIDEPG